MCETDLSRLPSRHYLEQHKAACPTCGQEIAPEVFQQNDLRKLQIDAQLARVVSELYNKKEQLAEATRLLTSTQESSRRLPELEAQADTLHQRAFVDRDAMQPQAPEYLDGQIFDLEQRRGEFYARLQAIELELVATAARLDTTKKVKTAFGGEVRNLMFDLIRGPLEKWTHHYIGILIDTGIQVQFPHQDCREKFEILVWNGAHSQELSIYSGGELWRITVAILLAFRQVLSYQSGCQLDFILMDDFAGELDDAGIANALQTLEQLTREDVGHIIMSVPREAYLPAGRYNRMTVTKQGGHSRVAAA